jgi:hypothetical protein
MRRAKGNAGGSEMIFILKKIPVLRKVVDERFVNHRLRSGSYGAIAGGILACGLFEYRHFVNHILSWDLLAVLLTIVAVKLGFMTWYLLTD